MTKRFAIAVVMILALVLGQFTAAPAMAKMSASDMNHAAMVMADQMPDCPGMDDTSLDGDSCQHHSEKDCCKHHASCTSGAVILSYGAAPWLIKPIRSEIPRPDDDMAAIWLEQNTPPPKS